MKRKINIFLTLVCTICMLFSFTITARAEENSLKHNSFNNSEQGDSHRFQGKDRYDTSLLIADELNDGQKVPNIVLASAHNFPDALTSSVLAFQLKAPIILVSPGHKDSQKCLDYIKEHLADNGAVTIIGGFGVISKETQDWLKDNGMNIKRLAGKDRFDTNSLIIDQMDVEKGTPVIIANAYNYPDALGAASLAASKGWPILLSGPANLPESVRDFLESDQPDTVYLVGGEGVLDHKIADQIEAISPDSEIQRLSGKDRFETLSTILAKFYPDPDVIYVANGFDYADTLAGSELAANNNAPILLVNPRSQDLPRSIVNYLTSLRDNNVLPAVEVLGGEGAVPQNLIDRINEILNSEPDNRALIKEKITVSDPSETGFTIALTPALDNLTKNNFILKYGKAAVTINSAATSDSGKTYEISADLQAGRTYTFTAVKDGYIFGTPRHVEIPNPEITVTNAQTLGTTNIVLKMSDELNGSEGDPNAFTVEGIASNPNVINVKVDGKEVTLTLDDAIVSTDANIAVSYEKTGVHDLTNGILVENFVDYAVDNRV